jgi:LysW-gamma-L-lysine carboxypeptidase
MSAFERNEALPETLLGLLERYSPTGHEAAAVEYLLERMRMTGYTHTFRDEAGNAVGVRGEGPGQILLLGHIDTVPGQILVHSEVVTDPESGLPITRLYGRGAVDAKGPLACFVDAAAALGTIPGWQVVVIGAVAEEGDSTGARYIVGRYRPVYTIIGEPSRWNRITLGYKGSAWARLTCRRALAHSASQAESASEAAFAAWQKLLRLAKDLNEGRSKNFEQVQLSLRGLSSGGDGFEEWAAIQVGARLPPGLPPTDWYARLAQALPGEQVEPLGFPAPAFQAEKNTPLARAFLAAIRQQQGQPGYVLKSGTADINIVAPVWGCPAVAYGPGDSSLDHTPHEHIVVEEYHQAVEALRQVLRQLTGI